MAYEEWEKKVEIASVLFFLRTLWNFNLDWWKCFWFVKKNQKPAGGQDIIRLCCKITGVRLSASQQGTPKHFHPLRAHFHLLRLQSSHMCSKSRRRSSLLLSASVASEKKKSVFCNLFQCLEPCAMCFVNVECAEYGVMLDAVPCHLKAVTPVWRPFHGFSLAGCSYFLPQSTVLQIRLIENFNSVCDCGCRRSFVLLCGPLKIWQRVDDGCWIWVSVKQMAQWKLPYVKRWYFL